MSLKKEYLFKYKPEHYNCFIESGTYNGDAVQLALESGFEKVISVEISEKNYKTAFRRFVNNKKVNLILGDSYFEFPKICSELTTPSVFWLDGHFDKFCDTIGFQECPLLKEIESIGMSSFKKHIVIIDDLRLFGNVNETLWAKDLDLDTVKTKLLQINGEYKFYYEDGWAKNDIMFCVI